MYYKAVTRGRSDHFSAKNSTNSKLQQQHSLPTNQRSVVLLTSLSCSKKSIYHVHSQKEHSHLVTVNYDLILTFEDELTIQDEPPQHTSLSKYWVISFESCCLGIHALTRPTAQPEPQNSSVNIYGRNSHKKITAGTAHSGNHGVQHRDGHSLIGLSKVQFLLLSYGLG